MRTKENTGEKEIQKEDLTRCVPTRILVCQPHFLLVPKKASERDAENAISCVPFSLFFRVDAEEDASPVSEPAQACK